MARRTREQEDKDALLHEADVYANNVKSRRLYAVEEKLEAIGINVTDLIELLDEYRSRG